MVAEEILKTEKTYVEVLSNLKNVFQKKMSVENTAFTQQEVKEIFPSALSSILMIQEVFKEELEKIISNWNNYSFIGKLFERQIPYIKFYISYVSCYESSLKSLRTAKNRDPESVKQFLKSIFIEIGDHRNFDLVKKKNFLHFLISFFFFEFYL